MATRLEREWTVRTAGVVKIDPKTYHKTVTQGGLSHEVWNDQYLKEYVESGIVAGYIGASTRTKRSDVVLERLLRKTGMRVHHIAEWMTSTSGRHMMDDVSKSMDEAELVKEMAPYAKEAPHEMLSWRDREIMQAANKAHDRVEKTMVRNSNSGATDTEPRYVLRHAIADHIAWKLGLGKWEHGEIIDAMW